MDTPHPSATPAAPATPPELTPGAAELAAKLVCNLHRMPREHFVRGTAYESLTAQLGAGARHSAARQIGLTVDTVPPGKQSCPYHLHHAQEEMFIVLQGHGTLRVAGEHIPIGPGDVIAIPAGPEYPHHILNTSSEPLQYLSLSTRQLPEVCEYPDSNKVLAFSARDGQHTCYQMHRRDDQGGLDYWDGEPGA
jgi:uncharacterized cupin superfamily protein